MGTHVVLFHTALDGFEDFVQCCDLLVVNSGGGIKSVFVKPVFHLWAPTGYIL